MNTQDINTQLKEELIRDEDLRLKPYRCTANKLTIGIGRNIEDRGISKEEALFMLRNDISECVADLHKIFSSWSVFSDSRQRALINMRFNLGAKRFRKFRRMLAAVDRLDWESAAAEMLDSRWARQVGDRAVRLAEMVREG